MGELAVFLIDEPASPVHVVDTWNVLEGFLLLDIPVTVRIGTFLSLVTVGEITTRDFLPQGSDCVEMLDLFPHVVLSSTELVIDLELELLELRLVVFLQLSFQMFDAAS